MKKNLLILSFFIINSVNTYAWNSLGHRLVAQIACYNMNAASKKVAIKYNKILNSKGRKYSLVNSSIWMDKLYSGQYKDFRRLHFINLPIIIDNVTPPKTNPYNAVFAVNIAQFLLKDKQTSELDKALAFRILWHVVADLHQPMHAVSRYSKRYRDGDMGGNLEILPKNKVAKNLHAYWDRGGGVLLNNRPYSSKQVKKLASVIMNRWPCNKEKVNLNPQLWAKESSEIAANFAYVSSFNYAYQLKAQEISLERIALAGCRLAAIIDKSTYIQEASKL